MSAPKWEPVRFLAVLVHVDLEVERMVNDRWSWFAQSPHGHERGEARTLSAAKRDATRAARKLNKYAQAELDALAAEDEP